MTSWMVVGVLRPSDTVFVTMKLLQYAVVKPPCPSRRVRQSYFEYLSARRLRYSGS
jgi:hypothetical protein